MCVLTDRNQRIFFCVKKSLHSTNQYKIKKIYQYETGKKNCSTQKFKGEISKSVVPYTPEMSNYKFTSEGCFFSLFASSTVTNFTTDKFCSFHVTFQNFSQLKKPLDSHIMT